MTSLAFHPAALDELEAAVTWYERARPGLGARFYDAVLAALERAEHYPASGSPVHSAAEADDDTRDWVVLTTVQPSTTAPASTGDGSTGGSSTSTGGMGATGPTTSTSDMSTGGPDSGTSGGGSTTLLLDIGIDKDVGDNKPPGCKGKIDFLFVIARDGTMQLVQDKLIAAFPKFIETIEAKFADFDFHIMVVDGDKEWGLSYCSDGCPVLDCKIGDPCCPVSICPGCDPPVLAGAPCCSIPDYPCGLLDKVKTCDETIGAGNVFAAGKYASNKPCSIAGVTGRAMRSG